MSKFPSRQGSFDNPSDRRGAPGLRGMSVLLLVYIAIVVVAVIALAAPAAGAVAYRLLTDGGILLLWLGAAASYGVWASRSVLKHETDAPIVLRFTTSAALGLGILSLANLGFGLAGLLNTPVAWILIVVGLIAGVAIIGRNDTVENRTRLAAWFFEPVGARWLWLLTAPVVVAVIVAALVPPGLMWNPNEPHGYDVVEYHLQIPREWFEAGRILPLHHNVFSFFPFNVEMHFLLAMHLRGGPWAGMYLAQFMHAAFILLCVLSIYGLAKWKSPKNFAILAAVALATVPWLARLAPIAYDEGGLLLFGTLSAGWALRAIVDPKNRIRRFALAGVMAGFACGCKLTAVPEILVAIAAVSAIIAIVDSIRGGNQFIARLAGIAIFSMCGVVTFLPWLARNVAWAHNPVFPEAVNLFGPAHFNETQVQRWHRAHSPQPDHQSVQGRLIALKDQVLADWEFGYAFLPMVVIALGIGIRMRTTWFLGGLLLVLLIVWLGFTHLQGRFFILALPLGALALAEFGFTTESRRHGEDIETNGPTAELKVPRPPQVAHADQQILPHSSVPPRLLRGEFLDYSGASPRRKAQMVFAALATIVALQTIVGSAHLYSELLERLYGRSLVAFLGDEELKWLMDPACDVIPPSSPIVLVGDAKAFWYYQIPMTRLHYKTVFDVDGPSSANLIDAWADDPSTRKGAWLVVEPQELVRLAKTYQPMPPVPPDLLDKQKVFVIPP